MRRLALPIGVLVIVIGATIIFAPATFVTLAERFMSPRGLYLAGALRLFVGAVLLSAAAGSRAPMLLRVLGAIVIVAGIATFFLSVDRAHAMLQVLTNLGPWSVRALGGVVTIIGVVIMAAVRGAPAPVR